MFFFNLGLWNYKMKKGHRCSTVTTDTNNNNILYGIIIIIIIITVVINVRKRFISIIIINYRNGKRNYLICADVVRMCLKRTKQMWQCTWYKI